MRGHVYIVNEETLPIHLEYMFVGTSAGEKDNHIGLLSDMFRVKKGDFLFFYIEGRQTKKGRFFGIFKAKDNVTYHIKGNGARDPNLPVKLIYRKEIIPYKIFPKGVLEWIALDKLPTYSKELLWTLIYRKMKGGRGNTMLFPWESERLISLIEDENQGKYIDCDVHSFCKDSYEIVRGDMSYDHNIGEKVDINIKDIKKAETYLQAYIMKKLDLNENEFYPEIFGRNIIWLGNEVFSGSGMQRIDIITIEKIDETTFFYRLIELKHPKSTMGINSAPMQLEYYINWAREDIGGHILGGKQFNIKPIVITLTYEFNTVPTRIIREINSLNSISTSPEIWEIDMSFNINRVM